MLLHLLLNLTVFCWSQNNQIPLPNLKSDQAQQAVQNALNNKFSVYGGTVTGNATFQNTTTFQTGIQFTNTTGNALTFQDGSTQNSAAVSVGGSNTWTGQNTFNNFQIRASSGVIYGDPTNGTQLSQYNGWWMKSNDGVTQSSGCVVVINVGNGNNAGSNFLNFTSTTTSSAQPFIGILMTNNCAPGSICAVATNGLVRGQCAASQTVGQKIGTFSTRCQGASQGTYSVQFSGMFMATDATTWCTYFLNGP